jgi:hypothetical protein
MTNRLALILGTVIVLACIADLVWNDGNALFFLARKVVDLIDTLTFWR